MSASKSRQITTAHIAPFIAFIGIMAIEKSLSVPPQYAYPIRLGIVSAMVLIFSRNCLKQRPSQPLAAIGMGLAVFAIWIGPDLISDYRQSFLFNNSVTGRAVSSIPIELRRQIWFVLIRTCSLTVLVPIIEELFWRAWMMRWLIDHRFWTVPLGKYTPAAFWTVAVLFASEHGPYWDVGLIAGVMYNWWMVRTRNLGDCILVHAVTNGALLVYVLQTGRWEYLS